MKKNIIIKIGILCYVIFLVVSFILNFKSGKEIGHNFISLSMDMFKIVPCIFILIGLFEVWVKKETVEKHLGHESGIRGYIWAILLAGTAVGGVYVAFPIAYSLYNKKAKLSVIFTYIGAAAICRIPMTTFEASFIGIKFTLVRLFTSLPLVIITSIILEKYLKKINYKIKQS